MKANGCLRFASNMSWNKEEKKVSVYFDDILGHGVLSFFMIRRTRLVVFEAITVKRIVERISDRIPENVSGLFLFYVH